MARKPPNMTEKLAAALLQLMEVGPDGKLRRIVDEKWAKNKSAKEIISLFECDHWPMSVFMGGGNNPQNLTWRTVEDHREKTKRDAKFHAKVRRKAREEAEKEKNPVEGDQRWNEREQCRQEYHDEYGWITLDYDKDAVYNGPLRTERATPKQIQNILKEELTEANKAYRKAIYAKRKAERKKWLAGIKGKK